MGRRVRDCRTVGRGPVRRARNPADPAAAARRVGLLCCCALALLGLVKVGGQAVVGGAVAAGAAPAAAGPNGTEQHGAQLLSSPPNPPPAVQPAGRTAAPAADVTIVAAGDIVCPPGLRTGRRQCQQQATADLARALDPDAVLPLGDNVYETGTSAEFRRGYAPTWGRLKSISYPVPGNHEYGYTGGSGAPSGAQGYFSYFGDRSHPLQPGCRSQCDSWYSYNLGNWHLIALDSQCAEVGGCGPGDRQYQWLARDLAAARQRCVLAYWHIPLFSSSLDHQPDMQPIFRLLHEQGADVVLTSHGHFYERFAPQDESGRADPRGMAQFVVGTGGRSFFPVLATRAANSRVLIADTFGVLQMTLRTDSYSWAFEPVGRSAARDRGTARCH